MPKTSERKQPYQRPKVVRTRTMRAKTQTIQIPSPPSPSSSNTPSPPLSPSNEVDTARAVYVEFFEKTYPNMKPRNDYDLMILGANRRKGTAEEIYAWADEQLRVAIQLSGSRERVFANTKKALDMVVGITGVRRSVLTSFSYAGLMCDTSASQAPNAIPRTPVLFPEPSTPSDYGQEIPSSTSTAWISWTPQRRKR